MVMPGGVRRDGLMRVNFSLDIELVTVSYEGILPDLFREGRGGGAGRHGGQPRHWRTRVLAKR